jgi:sensor histidine kinase YesM
MKLFEGTSKIKIFLIAFIIASAMAIMNASIAVSTELIGHYNELTKDDLWKIIYPLVDEFTGSYTFWLLIPIIIPFFKKFPLNKGNIFRFIPLYFFISLIFGLTHTLLMYLSRSVIYPALNLGEYDFGYLPFRILMEYLKQFMGFWTVFVIYTIFKVNKEKEEIRLKTSQLEEQLTKARLETLKMQLNPHFLFNTLNMISSTMYEDLNSADKMLATLSDLLRITLKSSGKGFNTLKKEIEILDLYIAIMKERFKDKLSIELKINEDTLNALIPNFIFQPLVENSIKYGMENLTLTHINVSTKRVNGNLQIQIKDNGPGIKEDSMNVLGSGVGLSNTVERLEKLYGTNYDFNWENVQEGGLLLTIKIPFNVED